jgi:tape measure domain-containing protein
MTELRLALRISQDGAGQVQAALEGVSTAEARVGQAGAGAAPGQRVLSATLDAVGATATTATTQLDGLATAEGRVGQAGPANATRLGELDRALATTGSAAAATSARVLAFSIEGQGALQSLATQAQATSRTLSAALGMSGVRNLSQEHAAAQAAAAMQAQAAQSLATHQAAQAAAVAQAELATTQAMLDEARAASALSAAQATAAQSARALVVSEADLRAVLVAIETPAERHAAQVARLNALYQAGAVSTAQYHRAQAAYAVSLAQSEQATAKAAATGGILAGSLGGIAVGMAGITAIQLAENLLDTDAALQRVDNRIAFFSKSAAEAKAAQDGLRATAKALNTDYTVLADTYAKLIPLEQSGLLTHSQTEQILVGMTNAGKALGATNAQLAQSFYGLGQVITSPIVQLDELRQVTDPLPGLLQAMERAAKLPAGGFRSMSDEARTNAFVIKALVGALHEYDGAAQANANAIDAYSQQVKTAWQELAHESDGLLTSIHKTGSNILKSSMEYATASLAWWKQALRDANDVFGNGVPDDAMAAARRNPPREAPQNHTGPNPEEEQKLLDRINKMEERALEDRLAAEKAATEVVRAEIEARYSARKHWLDQMAQQTKEGYEVELAAAHDNQQKQIEIKKQELEAMRAWSEEKLSVIVDELKEERALTQDRAKQIEIDGRIAQAEQAIEAGRASNAQQTRKLSIEEEQFYAQRGASLDKLAASMQRAEAITAAAQTAYGTGGSQAAQAAAEATRKRLDLEQRIANVRKEYAGDQAAQDAAEGYLRAEATAVNRLEELTKQSARDTTDYWKTAWEQAVRRTDDLFQQFWEDLFTGSRSAFGSLKNLFLSTLAEMAHAAITRPIMVGLIGSMGVPTAASAASSQMGLGSLLGGGLSSAASWAWNQGASLLGFGSPAATTAAGPGVASTAGMGASLASAGTGLYNGMLSPTLAGWGATLGSSMGLGLTGTAALSYAGLYSPWSAVGALAGQLMGLKGGSTIANIALPTVGGLAGGAVGGLASGAAGAALGATAGAWAGPIGAIIGALLGSAGSMLFKAAVPRAGGEFVYSSDNQFSTISTSTHAGANAGILVDVGRRLATAFAGLERQFGIELGRITIGMDQQGRSLRLVGADAQNTFYDSEGKFYSKKGKLEEAYVQDSLEKFTVAMLKRSSVLKQIDDALIRGAVATSDRLEEMKNKLTKATKIRVFEGERTDLGNSLEKLQQDYDRFSAFITENVAKSLRPVEQAKLTTAYQRQFEGYVNSLQTTLAGLIGDASQSMASALQNLDDTLRTLRAQDAELQQAAKGGKGKLSYAALTEADIQAAGAGGFRALLRQLTGEAQPLGEQLAQLAAKFNVLEASASQYGVSLEEVAAAEKKARDNLLNNLTNGLVSNMETTTQAIIDNWRGTKATLARLSTGIDSGLAGLDALTGTVAQDQVSKIIDLAGQRYQIEIGQYQALLSSAQSLKDTLSGLALSDVSPLSPMEQLSKAQGDFWKNLAGAQTGDATAMGNLGGSLSSFLSIAKDYYTPNSPEFRALYDRATGAAGLVADNALTDVDKKAREIQQRTANVLEKLNAYLERQASKEAAIADGLNAVAKAVGDGLGENGPIAKAVKSSNKAVKK